MNHVVKSLYVEIKREEYDALRARVVELEALQQSAGGVDERATFESWVVTQWHGAVFHRRDALSKHDPRYGQYVHDVIQNAWVGWQARAALNADRSEAATAHRRPNPAHGAPKPKGHNPAA